MISHDRYMMDKLCEHILVLKGDGEVKDIIGNYSAWRKIQLEEKRAESAAEKPKKAAPKSRADKPKTKLSFNEKYELEQIEKALPELEARKAELEEKMAAASVDHEELLKISSELGEVVNELETKELRWIELSEFL